MSDTSCPSRLVIWQWQPDDFGRGIATREDAQDAADQHAQLRLTASARLRVSVRWRPEGDRRNIRLVNDPRRKDECSAR